MNNFTARTRNIIYTMCFVLLVIIDQRRGSVTGQLQNILPNLAIIVLSLLVIPSCSVEDFKHPLLRKWFLISPVFMLSIFLTNHLLSQWFSGLVLLFVWGTLLLRAITKLHSFSVKALIYKIPLFSYPLFLFCFSRNDSMWPYAYLLVLVTFGLTDFEQSEIHSMLDGFITGAFVSFFMIQGLAFVFRPFDTLRYHGLYANPNANALLYLYVYCALLTRLVQVCLDSRIPHRKVLFTLLLFASGSMWSFVMLTACRSGLLGLSFATAVAGLFLITRFQQKKIAKSAGLIVGLLFSIFISFPIVYSSVRYIPAVFHHPVWFYNEYSESSVHSWDPWDSRKYTSWDDVIEFNFIRIKQIFEDTALGTTTGEIPFIQPLLATHLLTPGMLASVNEPLIEEISYTSMPIRDAIYHYYLTHLNLFGHKNSEDGVQVTASYFAPHAHNLFLQYAFSFGILFGIVFLLTAVAVLFSLLWRLFSKASDESGRIDSLEVVLCFGSVLAFGLTEMMWTNGQMSLILFFLMPALLSPFPKINTHD